MGPTSRRRRHGNGAATTTERRAETAAQNHRADAPASMANLAPVLGLDEDRVKRMLDRLRWDGWVASLMRGMTERRQHRFFLTSRAVDLIYATDHQHPSPREEARASGPAASRLEGELPHDFRDRFALDHDHSPHLEA